MEKSFVDELLERLSAGPALPVDVWLKFAEELVENFNSGELSASDRLSVGIEDGKVVVSIYDIHGNDITIPE